MTRWMGLMVAGAILGLGQAAFAQEWDSLGDHAATAAEEKRVLEDPPGVYRAAKAFVEKVDPSYETVWLVSEGEFAQGVSGAFANLKHNSIHLASARLGVGTGVVAYGGLGLDLPGITKTLLPDAVERFASQGGLGHIWSLIGKYGRVGPIGGYNWDTHRAAYGFAAGATIPLP